MEFLGLTVDELRYGLITFLFIAVSLCLRAYGQAWVADRLGDRTPALEGRLTLNPLPHVDLVGTVVLPLVCIFYLQPHLEQIRFFLGWAKPVPMNASAFTHHRKHILWCLLGQTAVSLILMLVAAVAGGVVCRFHPELQMLIVGLISINACLVVLDLLPLPPLPGAYFLMYKGWITEESFAKVARWGGLVLIIAMQLPPVQMLFGILQALVAAPFVIVYRLILG